MPSLLNRLGALVGLGRGGIQGAEYTSDLGFDLRGHNYGAVSPGVSNLINELRNFPNNPTASQAEKEADQAGVAQAAAVIYRSIAQSRKKKVRALASAAKAQMSLDAAIYQSSSQLAQYQAGVVGGMSELDFQNRMVGAELGGKVSTFRENNATFSL